MGDQAVAIPLPTQSTFLFFKMIEKMDVEVTL
jgi:hypothetical protein